MQSNERKEYRLRPLWDAILDLYERFDAYCAKHKLRYYVTGGTLLGAVRHNGFIPWDDDFDVVMPRPDYTRFVTGWRSMPMADCALRSFETDAQSGLLFGKFTDCRQDVQLRVERESGLRLNDGICIDVIPIDGMPKNPLWFYYWALKRSTWRHGNSGALYWKILLRLLWRDHSPKAFQEWLASYDYDTSPCVEDYNANGRRFRARILSSQSFANPVIHKFDRLYVPMPREWDKFLRLIFGNDYMTLPPEDRRRPSHQSL